MVLVGFKKLFLELEVGAPGSTHNARFLRYTGLFGKITASQGLPNKTVPLDYEEISLVTVDDFLFSSFS